MTNFVDWLYVLNNSTDSDFQKHIEEYLDVPYFLRTMVVESFLLTEDCFANNGKNYYAYQLNSGEKIEWLIIVQDFDMVFEFSLDVNNIPDADTDIVTYLTRPNEPESNRNVLLTRIFAIQAYRDQYVKYYKTFITTLFGTNSNIQPAKRHTDMMQFVLPWVARDRMVQLSSGLTTSNFMLYSEQTAMNLPLRYQNVTIQLENM